MGAAFRLQTVSKTFDGRKALDGVDLLVERGEFLALIGPSGSGKSTLLRTMNGLLRVDPGPGRVEVFEAPLQVDGRLLGARALRARVGFVFQQFNLVGRLSLLDNVMIGALSRLPTWRSLLGRWPANERGRGLEALARVGVAEQADQRAASLSGGQQQRGAIARALVQGAEAVLADEPVSSLDPAASRRVMEILRSLNEVDGLTVVVTLHQVDHALTYAKRIVGLHAGRVVFDGPPGALDAQALAAIYGERLETAVPGPGPPLLRTSIPATPISGTPAL